MKNKNDGSKKPQKHYKSNSDIIQEIINSAIVRELSDEQQLNPAKESRRDITHIVPILNEYLDNFFIIGHDVMGNEVAITYAKNANDRNAVTKLFHDVFVRTMIDQQKGLM